MKTSMISIMPKEELQKIIDESSSYKEILKKLDICQTGGNWRSLKNRILLDGLSIEKLKLNKKIHINKTIDLKDILVKESIYTNRGTLKKRLISNGMLKNECSICHLKDEWNGGKLVMILDHINGINNDHRIENIRLICPNCNSQTNTFAGRNLKKDKKCIDCGIKVVSADRCRGCYNKMRIRTVGNKCVDCGKIITIKSKRCKKCHGIKNNVKKVEDRPSREDLAIMINTMSWVSIGRKYGVSDNAIRKWARSCGLLPIKVPSSIER